MPKLTDTQLVILAAAARRDSGDVLPLPKSLTTNKGAATSVLKSLVKRGFIDERRATLNDSFWRETEDGHRMALAITVVGLKAIGIEPDLQTGELSLTTQTKPGAQRGKTTAATACTTWPSRSRSLVVRPGTKQALLVDLLKRKGGATVAEISEATGWQHHSVRGAISGALKKRLGLSIASQPVDGRGRVYHIVASH